MNKKFIENKLYKSKIELISFKYKYFLINIKFF